MKKAVLLSYPRSGNTWVRHVVESIAKVKTSSKSALLKSCPKTAPVCLIKDHWVRKSREEKFLILLLRDYHEVLVRHAPQGKPVLKRIEFEKDGESKGVNYLACIYEYLSWDPRKRYLVYYEDVISDPIGTFTRLFEWLGLETKSIKAWFEWDNYMRERNKCLESYQEKNRSATKGAVLKYHRYKVKEEIHRCWTRYIMDKHPNAHLYLKRYDQENLINSGTVMVDIDGTICTITSDYRKARPISENIEKVNNMYRSGNKIIYWTARGSSTGIDWYKETERQLRKWGCLYHKLEVSKPFYDLLICDKSIRMEEL